MNPETIFKKRGIREIKEFLKKYEQRLSLAAMALGFIVDSLTLTRVDLWLDNLILLGYLTIIGLSILIIHAHDIGHFQRKLLQKGVLWLPLAMQFAFGGLFSGFVVLYSRSSSLGASWPFLSILIILLIGNEFFQKQYRRLNFQINIFFIAIFSYLIFAVPVLANSIGPAVFVTSGLSSLLLIFLFVRGIAAISSWKVFINLRPIVLSVAAIFIGFNILYFTNVIPPIPLALKDIAIAHEVKLEPGQAQISVEPPPWYKFYRIYDTAYHRFDSEPIYVYSAIFAPTDLTTTVFHEWAFYDEGEWKTTDRVQYSIYGGRDEGYRGFSVKINAKEGKWRVSVKTKNGQLLGRTKFEIVNTSVPPELEIKIR